VKDRRPWEGKVDIIKLNSISVLFVFALVFSSCIFDDSGSKNSGESISAQILWLNPLPQGNALNSNSCVNSKTCWTAGAYGTILKTSNGGNSWAVESSGTINDLKSVFFSDGNTGWVIGDRGTVLKTNNGGGSWVIQTSGTGNGLNNVLKSVYFSYGVDGLRGAMTHGFMFGLGTDFLVLGVLVAMMVWVGSYFFSKIQL